MALQVASKPFDVLKSSKGVEAQVWAGAPEARAKTKAAIKRRTFEGVEQEISSKRDKEFRAKSHAVVKHPSDSRCLDHPCQFNASR